MPTASVCRLEKGDASPSMSGGVDKGLKSGWHGTSLPDPPPPAQGLLGAGATVSREPGLLVPSRWRSVFSPKRTRQGLSRPDLGVLNL